MLIRVIPTEVSTLPALRFPDWSASIKGPREFRLCCDANQDGFGAAFEQAHTDRSASSIPFVSRAALDNGWHWYILELEAGTIIWVINRLRPYLFQISFIVYSDHNALEHLCTAGRHRTRIQCCPQLLTACPHRIENRRGFANANANFLSRLPQPATDTDDRGPSNVLTPPTYRRPSSALPARSHHPPLNCTIEGALRPPSCFPPQTQSASPLRTFRTFDWPDIVLSTFRTLPLPYFPCRTASTSNRRCVLLLQQRAPPPRNSGLLRLPLRDDRPPDVHGDAQHAAALPSRPYLAAGTAVGPAYPLPTRQQTIILLLPPLTPRLRLT